MSIGRFILCRSTERSGAYTSVLQFLIDNSNSLTKGKMFALQKTIGNARLARQIVQQRRTVVDLPPNVKVTFFVSFIFITMMLCNLLIVL